MVWHIRILETHAYIYLAQADMSSTFLAEPSPSQTCQAQPTDLVNQVGPGQPQIRSGRVTANSSLSKY